MNQSSRKRLVWSLLGRRRRRLSAEERARMLYRRRVINRRILATVLGFSLAMGIAAAALFLRLSAGPLDMQFADGLVRPALQKILASEGSADFSRLELEWVGGRLRVRVADFAVHRPDGQLVVKAPGAYVGFSLLALWSGNVVPATLEVKQPVVALTILGDSSVAVGGAPVEGAKAETLPVISLLEPQFLTKMLPTGQGQFSQGSLHYLKLEDVTVTVTDDRWGITRQFDPFTVELERTLTQSLAVTLTAPDQHGGWQVALDLGRVRDGEREASLVTKRFSLASLLPANSGLDVGDARLDAKLSARLNENGLVTPLAGEISLGAGHVRGEDIDADFGPLLLKARLETDARTLNIFPALFSAGGIEGIFSGRVLFPAAGDPTRPVRMDFRAENLSFNNGTRFPEVNAIAVAAAYELSNRTLWIDYLRAGAEDTVVELKGTARFVGRTPELKLACNVGTISVEAAKALWPSIVAPHVRKWVLANVSGGQVEKGIVSAAIPSGFLVKDDRPLQRNFVRTSWQLKGMNVLLTPKLPAAKGVSAHVEATGSSARVDALGGKIELPAGVIEVPNATFTASDFSPKRHYGRLNLLLVGDMQSLIQLAEQNDYKLGKSGSEEGRGFDIAKLKGEALANAEVQIPLWRDAKVSDSKTFLEAELRNVSGQKILDERDLKDGAFQVKAEGGSLVADGTAIIDDIKFKLSMTRDSAGKTLLRAETEADEALRAKLGINLSPWVSGMAIIRRIEDFSEETPERIEIDLTASKFSVPQLMFDKPAGQQALLSFIPKGDTQVTQLEDVYLQGKGWMMRGRINLNEKNEAELVEFSDIKLRPDDNFSARIERTERGMQAQISGRSMDMRPFLSHVLSNSDADTGAADIELRIARAVGSNSEVINDLHLVSSEQGGRTSHFSLSGSLGQGAALQGQLLADQGRPYTLVSTNDGGALLRFLDIYTHVSGGRLTLTQTLTDKGNQLSDGVVFLEQFRLVDEPAIQRLFGAAPQQQGGPRQIADNPVFDRLRVAFSRVPGVIQVREGVLRNPEIGITFQGQVDFRNNAIDMRGSFIPMYALNNLVARLPVVGMFMGGPNEGLLGVTFAINGSLSNPLLRINPASMIAPGFLRGLFQVPDQTGQMPAPIRPGSVAPPQPKPKAIMPQAKKKK